MTRDLAPDDWKLKGSAPMTAKQQRMLNAVCGCLEQNRWHGIDFDKDDYRHLLSAVVLGERFVPGVDRGKGPPGFVRMARSSKELTMSQAAEAITMGIWIGDHPEEQKLDVPRVRWSRTVLFGMGYSPRDVEELAA